MGNILKVGLIYAALGILLSLIIHMIDKSLMFKGAVSWSLILIGLLVLIFAGRKFFRDPELGLLSYGGAMKNLLLAAIIGSTLSTVFSIALYNNDREMKTLFKDYSIELSESMLRMTMGLTGADEAQIEDMVDEAKEELEETAEASYPYSWAKMPMNLITVIVMSLILALIAAIFVREKDTAHT